jgi:hypothetical protein
VLDLFGIQKRKKRRAMWTRVAHELGGEFHLPKGFWRPTRERIEAIVGGVPVVLDTFVVSTGKTSQVYTRVTADLVYGPAPKLLVQKKGVLSALGNILREDVTLGHATFDDTFVVRCDEGAVARRMITERAMQLLLATFLDGKLTYNRKRLELITGGHWNEEQRLRDGIAIIVEVAARDIYGVEALRSVEGGALATNDHGWPVVEVATSARVVIGAEDQGGRLVMVARTSDAPSAEPIELEIVDGNARDGERVSKLPPGAHVALRRVGSGVLAVTGEGIHFRWRELELDAARLRAGADLLGAIAAGRDASAYR